MQGGGDGPRGAEPGRVRSCDVVGVAGLAPARDPGQRGGAAAAGLRRALQDQCPGAVAEQRSPPSGAERAGDSVRRQHAGAVEGGERVLGDQVPGRHHQPRVFAEGELGGGVRDRRGGRGAGAGVDPLEAEQAAVGGERGGGRVHGGGEVAGQQQWGDGPFGAGQAGPGAGPVHQRGQFRRQVGAARQRGRVPGAAAGDLEAGDRGERGFAAQQAGPEVLGSAPVRRQGGQPGDHRHPVASRGGRRRAAGRGRVPCSKTCIVPERYHPPCPTPGRRSLVVPGRRPGPEARRRP